MPIREINYTKCGVICHGFSELQIAKYIKSHLRLPIEIWSKDNGRHSIQIVSLNNFLKDRIFNNVRSFANECGIKYERKELVDFKLFIIMDTDDCSESQKKDFISKKMFENHPLCKYIVPVFNTPNLEEILVKSGIMPKKISDREKGQYYLKTFPINNNDNKNMNAYDEISLLRDKLKRVKETNLDAFVEYTLNLVKK